MNYFRSAGRAHLARRAPLLLSLLLPACGDDLGECDRVLAQELVYSNDGMVATKGQALVHDSCGNGGFCHSALASSGKRYGAPDGMDFDLLPFPSGWPTLLQYRDDVWALVRDGGHMIAGDTEAEVYGDHDWVFDAKRHPDAAKLPPLQSREGKGALRNWLACGAPLVSDSAVPQWAQAPCSSSGDAAFDTLYETVLKPNCTIGCHNRSAAGKLDMSTVCGAYDALHDSGDCGVRLRPGDLSSPLLDQVQAQGPKCGSPMPPDTQLASDAITKIRSYVINSAPNTD